MNNEKNSKYIENIGYDNTKKERLELNKFLYKKGKRGVIKEYLETIIFLVLIMICVRTLLIDSYTVPSQSMYPTLKPYDKLIAFKSYYGVRLPIVNFTIPEIVQPKRGDVIIFEHPDYQNIDPLWELFNLLTLGIARLDNNETNVRLLVKRCIAIAGDTVEMDLDKNVIINNTILEKEFVNNSTYSKNESINKTNINLYREYNIDKSYIIQEEVNTYSYSPTTKTLYIPKKGDIFIAEKIKAVRDIDDLSNSYRYKINDFTISSDIWYRYEKLIIEEFGKDFYRLGKDFYRFEIQHNYYFGIGDNRDNSRDSRAWGFIRDDLIFGVPLFKFFPINRIGIIK